ncbi:MAG: PAS domain S-box protein [Deltaproteobacteria bacterium]|nr:PAS domain S-box protein [Deltaproteobacteria bacterium]
MAKKQDSNQHGKALPKEEALFRGLFDHMPSGSAIYEVINDGSKGSDYIIKCFNKTALRYEGKTLDQVVGKSLSDLRPSIDDYGLIPIMKRVWETGSPAHYPATRYQDEHFSNYYENYIFRIPSGELITIYNDVTHQKEAEMALRESEERFELAMRFSNDGIFDWNLETDRIYYSPGWKKLLGYEDHEIKNTISEWERLTRPEDVEASWKMLNELLEGKRDRFEMEFRMRHKEGHWVDILSRANAVFDENGKAVRIVGTHVDITERKRLEVALHKQEALHKQAQKVARLGHWELTPSVGILDWCEEMYHILGLDPRKGAPALLDHKDIVHPEDWRRYERSVNNALTKGLPFDIDFQFIRPDGEIRWMNAKGEVEKDGKGNIVRLFGTAQDITQFKSVEIALEKSEKRYREIFESITDIFYRTDMTGKLQIVSPACKRILGYDPDELIGSSLSDLYVEPEQRRRFLEQLNEKKEVFEYETALTARGGSVVWVSTNAHFHVDDKGNKVGVQGVSRDITPRKRAEAEREAMEKQFLQAQKMEAIGTLAGGIAHDFNNILMPVIGYTDLALSEVDQNTSLGKYLREIYIAGNRATDLVRQILTFARQSEEKPMPVRVGTIAKEALKFLRATIPASIDIREHIITGSCVLADPTRIHQILMNLFTNAVQGIVEERGVIEVHISDVVLDADHVYAISGLKPGNYLKMVVRDTGKGIAKEHLDSVFEPYFTTKAKGEGTGLGLSVVHGIVKKCGGEIAVDSEWGKGTVFTIHLPVTEAGSEAGDCAPTVLPKGEESVLMVDDEASIVRLNTQILKDLGYRVTASTSSIDALELFRSKPDDFDLVITDMTMPGMTGDKLASELIHISPHIPIILCTGHSKRISPEKATAIGIKRLCMKPLSKGKLANTVRAVLDETKNSTPG